MAFLAVPLSLIREENLLTRQQTSLYPFHLQQRHPQRVAGQDC